MASYFMFDIDISTGIASIERVWSISATRLAALAERESWVTPVR